MSENSTKVPIASASFADIKLPVSRDLAQLVEASFPSTIFLFVSATVRRELRRTVYD